MNSEPFLFCSWDEFSIILYSSLEKHIGFITVLVAVHIIGMRHILNEIRFQNNFQSSLSFLAMQHFDNMYFHRHSSKAQTPINFSAQTFLCLGHVGWQLDGSIFNGFLQLLP